VEGLEVVIVVGIGVVVECVSVFGSIVVVLVVVGVVISLSTQQPFVSQNWQKNNNKFH
jgi:hypothetical protein